MTMSFLRLVSGSCMTTRFTLLRVDVPLDADRGVGRPPRGAGLTPKEPARLAGGAARDGELVDAVRALLPRRVAHGRRPADDQRGRKMLALLTRLLPVDV